MDIQPGREPVWGGLPPETVTSASPALGPAAQPSAPRPWGIIGSFLWTGAMIGSMALAGIPAVFVYIPFARAWGKPIFLRTLQTDGDFFSFYTFISLAMTLLVLALAIGLRRPYRVRDYLALRAAPLKHYLLWGGVLLAYGVAAEYALSALGVASVPPWMKEVIGNIHRPLFFGAAIVLAAPLLEETVFRGFWLTGLLTRLGPVPAALLSALPWAALHVQYEWSYIPLALGMGIIFALARHYSKSLWVPLALHSLNNLMAIVQMVNLE